MNELDYLQSLFSEFGYKTRFIRHDLDVIHAIKMMLKIKGDYNVFSYIVMLSRFGIIEVLDILDEAALVFIS